MNIWPRQAFWLVHVLSLVVVITRNSMVTSNSGIWKRGIFLPNQSYCHNFLNIQYFFLSNTVYESSKWDLLIKPIKKVIIRVNDRVIIFSKSLDDLVRFLLVKEKQFTLCRNLQLPTNCWTWDSYTGKKLFFIKYYIVVHFAAFVAFPFA